MAFQHSSSKIFGKQWGKISAAQCKHSSIQVYQDAFIKEETQHFQKKYGTTYAFEAKNRYGELVFRGIGSCAATSVTDALQEALVEASITARSPGFQQILLLSCCKKLVQVCSRWRIPDWKERTMMADISHLQQMGLVSKLISQSSLMVTLGLFVSFPRHCMNLRQL